MQTVILYIAMSLDGFIAKADGGLDWLTKYNNEGEDYGYGEMLSRVGSTVMGRKTYEQVKGDIRTAYSDKSVYIITNSDSKKIDNMTFVSGDTAEIVKSIKQNEVKDVWLVGGADLVNQFVKAGLVDEMIVTIVPIILGTGIRLFTDNNPEVHFKHIKTIPYRSGLVSLYYQNSKNIV